jgi:cytochrome c oxidase assembly factor CtaG
MRRLLLPLIAFAAPFLIYWLYRRFRVRDPEKAWPLTVLFVAGAVLAAQTLVIAALTEPKTMQRPPEPTMTEIQ